MEGGRKQQPVIPETPERRISLVQDVPRENSRVNQPITEGVSQDSEYGEPSIDDVKWKEKTVVVFWSKAKGAQKHILTITSENGEEVKRQDVKQSPTTIISEELAYGGTYNFGLEARDNGIEIKNVDRPFLIGGQEAVTKVVAEKNEENPRRSVVVTWQAPSLTPHGYRLILGNQTKDKRFKQDVPGSKVKWKFWDLKTSTHYCVCVCPMYDGRSSEGTWSNTVLTDKRNQSVAAKKTGFDQPEAINAVKDSLDENEYNAKLTWTSVEMGENFKVTGYHVTCHQKRSGFWFLPFTNRTVCDKTVQPDKTSTMLNLKRGGEYDVKVTTLFMDLDTEKEKKASPKKYEFSTDLGKTNLQGCKCENGIVSFSWEPVNGAAKYCLVIEDEFTHTKLVEDQSFDAELLGEKCVAKLKLSEKLRIGIACRAKVHAKSACGGASETDWKSYILGGEKVPRNVRASRNQKNPERSVTVTFDSPAKGHASEYKIVATPESGHERSICCTNNNVTMEYLRKGVKYKFEVHAKWDLEWSEGSPSNSVSTEGGGGKPLLDLHDMHGANVDLSNALFTNKSIQVFDTPGKDFGQVVDLESIIEQEHSMDTLILTWNAPKFGKTPADYKVELYKVEIRKIPDSPANETDEVTFEKNRIEYQSKRFKLKLGESYQATVSTMYLDIDEDCFRKSTAVKKCIAARPCTPNVVKNKYDNDTLRIEWNAARGAQYYELEIFANDDKEATFIEKMGDKRVYEKKFDETFGYGTSYYAKIKAIGAPGKENSTKTLSKIIGGDHVATKVCATSNHHKVTDPSTQVFLNWTAPKITPKEYEVSSFPSAEPMHVGGTKCLVSGLKAGTEYYFTVKAIYEEKEKPSGGCCSEKISTTPTPTQVKEVWIKPGKNPSSSAQISWQKVDAEKENETTKYRVTLVKDDGTAKREVYVDTETVVLRDLDSGSSFIVTVAGGNSEGYGRDSDTAEFTTDLGTPKNVVLQENKENSSSSLKLIFSDAEGEPNSYKATLCKLTDNIDQSVGEETEVEPGAGYTFGGLESNREYFVNVYACFPSGNGKDVKSKTAMTAPSASRITECRCGLLPDGETSPRELIVKWDSDDSCNVHQVKVMCGQTAMVESQLNLENQNELLYPCLYESVQYSIQVRSRRKTGNFGQWSKEALINLGPKKLQDVSAALEEEGYDILIECDATLTLSPQYFMQALCDGMEPLHPVEPCKESDRIKWRFTPPQHAQKYKFKLWAENNDKMRGESTLSSPVISKPAKMVFESVKATYESTDIKMDWKEQERCDTYEIRIRVGDQKAPENVARTSGVTYRYRCRVPGKRYLVSIRALRENITGDWADDKPVILAPGKVKFLDDVNTDNEPVSSVEVNWEPLAVTPSGYHLKLFCNDEEVAVKNAEETATRHIFTDKLKPGSLCFCTIAAYNESTKIGKASKSRTFRIKWLQASNFIIENDENDPSRRAKMKWDAPPGVNCFRLEMENNQSGVVTPICLCTSPYVFESGIPGNTYSVRLYSGCDGRYDIKHVSETMIMNPSPPEELRVKNFSSSPHDSFLVCFKDMNGGKDTKHEVVVEDLARKDEPRRETTSHRTLVVKGLTPGATYIIAVETLKNGKKSEMTCYDGQVMTYPDVPDVVSLAYEKGKVIFTWKSLDIKPMNYEVRWEEDGAIRVRKVEEERFVLGDVKLSTMYKFTVAAVNEAGRGFFNNWRECLTGLAKPSQVEVSNITQHSAWIQFTAPQKEPPSYRVSVTPRFCEKSIKPKVVKTNYCVVENLKPGTEHVVQVWSIDPESPNLDSEKTAPKYFTTVPATIVNLRSKIEQGNILFEWDELDIKPDDYIIQWRVDNEPITEEHTQAASFMILFLKPAYCYSARVMAVNSSGNGPMSNWKNFLTTPAEVEIMEYGSTENDPVEDITVTWKPLKATPTGYLVALFRCNKEVEVVQKSAKSTDHVFKDNLKPGALYYCTIAAFKDHGDRIMGKESRSKNYLIKWKQASNFTITPDENAPFRRMKMTWDAPEGVDRYKLEIENNQSGVVTPIEVSETKYIFESGIPGNTYIVRLRCGCDNRYDIKDVKQTMTIEPEPPTDLRVTAINEVNGLIIEFQDEPSSRKKYHITAEGVTDSQNKTEVLTSQHSRVLPGLVPGESYKVSVCTIIGKLRSKQVVAEEYTSTLPEKVANLRSKIEKGSICFEWDEPNIKPNKYVVQWRVDNEPLTEEHTQATIFKLFFFKPAHCYSARVIAVNGSGAGPMSDWEHFITDPSPPYRIRVYPDKKTPETSLVVEFDDERDSLKRYRVRADGPEDKPKIVETHQHFAILTQLQPGSQYMVKIKTIFCGKESIWAHHSGFGN